MNRHLTRGNRQFDRITVIQNADPHAGFSNLLTSSLNGVRLALDNNCLPVVIHDRNASKHFYDPAYGENVWEYYFEPVMGLGSEELAQLTRSGEIPEDLVQVQHNEWHQEKAARIAHEDPDQLTTFWVYLEPENPKEWMDHKRRLGREYVAKYLRVKPDILERAEQFADQFIRPQFTIGVHIRGTDFAYAAPTSTQTYFQALHELLHDCPHSGIKIFLATDQQQFVELFRDEFGDRIIVYSGIRTDGDLPAFLIEDGCTYKKGEDVLMDILLLARCNYLLKGAATVGELALWFNPGLECTDFALSSRWRSNNMIPAYLTLNIDGVSIIRQKWLIARENVKMAVFKMAVVIGPVILPAKLRDWLWKRYGRQAFFPTRQQNQPGGTEKR